MNYTSVNAVRRVGGLASCGGAGAADFEHLIYELPNDTSMVSVSVDNFNGSTTAMDDDLVELDEEEDEEPEIGGGDDDYEDESESGDG